MNDASASSDRIAFDAARQYAPQPQWEQFALMRDYAYTHTQPQWLDVLRGRGDKHTAMRNAVGGVTPASSKTHAPSWSPCIVRPPPLEGRRVCMTCLELKEACRCKTCFVCKAKFLKNRHHCRRCWHAVCSGCWGYKHYVHMLGRPMVVCDRCSVPWALANALRRDEAGLLWGLYALRIAGEMPRLCIGPTCRIFTHRPVCYQCGLPTVSTRPHVSRVVRANGASSLMLDEVNVLDMQQLSLRAMEVNEMASADVEGTFRRVFHCYEEVLAFRAVTTAKAAQCLLLANVAAAVAYEYIGAPNITLALSDIPYARLLQVTVSRERYTVLEAPGCVKFIAFPGTHNWRTRWVDLQFSRVQKSVWTTLHEGLRAGPGGSSSEPVALCGGMRKTWSYYVHGGFAHEAEEAMLPLDSLLEDVRCGGYTLVLCGHSLGGAIAQYLSLELLHKAPALLVPSDPQAEPKLTCVTFGAPLLGNYELADHVYNCGWSRLFHNFVYRSDVVPRLSCTDELAWDAQSRLTHSLTTVFAAAQKWWRGWRGNSDPDTLRDESDEGEDTVPPASDHAAVLHTPVTEGLENSPAGGLTDGSPTLETESGPPDMATNASMTMSDAEAEQEAQLAAYMDTAIRTSCDLLEDEKGKEGRKDTAAAAMQRDADVEAALNEFATRCSHANASKDGSRVKRTRSHEGDSSGEDREGEREEMREGVGRWGANDASLQGSPPANNSSCSNDLRVAPLSSPTAAAAVAAPPDVMADVVVPSHRLHRRFACFGRYHFVQYGAYGYVSTDDSETAFQILKHGSGERAVLQDHSVAAYNRGLMLHLYRNSD
jgi:pimeloyl-ACP methyl ester carboxylesterase